MLTDAFDLLLSVLMPRADLASASRQEGKMRTAGNDSSYDAYCNGTEASSNRKAKILGFYVAVYSSPVFLQGV